MLNRAPPAAESPTQPATGPSAFGEPWMRPDVAEPPPKRQHTGPDAVAEPAPAPQVDAQHNPPMPWLPAPVGQRKGSGGQSATGSGSGELRFSFDRPRDAGLPLRNSLEGGQHRSDAQRVGDLFRRSVGRGLDCLNAQNTDTPQSPARPPSHW